MTEVLDQPKGIRPGEELDTDALLAYLASHIPELEAADALEVRQFPSGHSNLTYLISAGGRDYVLRRPPFGSRVKSAHDMSREYRILSKLCRVYPAAPEPLVFCQDESVLGADFYVMRRIEGVILRRLIPPGLPIGEAELRGLTEALIDKLAELHAFDYEAAGLADLGRPAGYIQRQVEGWTKRYTASQTDPIEVVDKVASWLADTRPPEVGAALIHNDFKLDNVVLDASDPGRIIGVLDWEMSTLGDPLMDLGTTLSYWIESGDEDTLKIVATGPTDQPGALTRRQIVERYAEKSGRQVANPVFYYAFGLFKTAVVAQQIYYRYKQGLTKDERFASHIYGVQILCNQAAKAIESGQV